MSSVLEICRSISSSTAFSRSLRSPSSVFCKGSSPSLAPSTSKAFSLPTRSLHGSHQNAIRIYRNDPDLHFGSASTICAQSPARKPFFSYRFHDLNRKYDRSHSSSAQSPLRHPGNQPPAVPSPSASIRSSIMKSSARNP